MFIDVFLNNGKKYIRLAESYRAKNAKGQIMAKKRIILNLGPIDKFDDGQPDYVARLRDSFRNGNPLIDELLPYVEQGKRRQEYLFRYLEGDPMCIAETKKYGHCLIERILDELGILAAIRSYKSFDKIKFDVCGLFKLLVFGRILDPKSKIATYSQNSDYYEPITNAEYSYNIYDTLDFIIDHKKQIVNRINSRLIKKAGRENKIIFYDVTNFFFETERPDDDIETSDGTIIKGLRKNGVSKEERKLPIVQMGLFMDEKGMPISIEMFPGNTLDHLTVNTALSKNIDGVVNSRYIFIGDRGICNYKIIGHLLRRNKGYIMSKSIKRSTFDEQNWIIDDNGYIQLNANFKYKSKIVRRAITDDDGKEMTISEKVVSYWSKKFYDKETAENKSFLDFLEKLTEHPENFRITAAQAKKMKNFLKKEYVNTETGELVDSSKLKSVIDMDKVNQYRKFFGYYQIITSELTMDDLEVIDKYHGLTQIENQFRIMKSDLNTRPIFVRTPEHIEAHLIICLIALIAMRLIQNKVVKYKKSRGCNNTNAYWEMGLTGSRIQNALNKWNVIKIDSYYQMCNIHDPDLNTILKAVGLHIPNKFFSRSELVKLKNTIKIL